MAAITFPQGSHKYPAATNVSVYAATAKIEGAAPQQASIVGPVAVAADGSLTFTGLNDSTRYTAYASVGGVHTYTDFITEGARPTGPGGAVILESLNDMFRRIWLPGPALSIDPALATGNITAAASGTLRLVRALLPAGKTISRVGFVSGTTAAGTPTAQTFAVIRQSDRSVLAKSVDDAATAWAANTVKELLLSAPYTSGEDVPVYLAMIVAAATPPTLAGAVLQNAALNGAGGSLVQAGDSNTGLAGTPASIPATVTAPTAVAGVPLAWAR